MRGGNLRRDLPSALQAIRYYITRILYSRVPPKKFPGTRIRPSFVPFPPLFFAARPKSFLSRREFEGNCCEGVGIEGCGGVYTGE